MDRIFVNVIGLFPNGEEHTVWSGTTDADQVMLVVAPFHDEGEGGDRK